MEFKRRNVKKDTHTPFVRMEKDQLENNINGMVTRRISSWPRAFFFHHFALSIRVAFSLSVLICGYAHTADTHSEHIRMLCIQIDGQTIGRSEKKIVNIFCLIRWEYNRCFSLLLCLFLWHGMGEDSGDFLNYTERLRDAFEILRVLRYGQLV